MENNERDFAVQHWHLVSQRNCHANQLFIFKEIVIIDEKHLLSL